MQLRRLFQTLAMFCFCIFCKSIVISIDELKKNHHQLSHPSWFYMEKRIYATPPIPGVLNTIKPWSSTNQPRGGHPKVSLTNRIQSYQLKGRKSRSLSIRHPFKVAKNPRRWQQATNTFNIGRHVFLFSAHHNGIK